MRSNYLKEINCACTSQQRYDLERKFLRDPELTFDQIQNSANRYNL